MIEHDDTFLHALDQRQIVTGDQHGGAELLEFGEKAHDFDRELRIEITGGFVGDQHARLGDDCARNADALLFARR